MSPPPGLTFHVGIGEGADFATVTVWESMAAYDAFAPTFARVMSERGFEVGTPQILPVHHFLPPTGSSDVIRWSSACALVALAMNPMSCARSGLET